MRLSKYFIFLSIFTCLGLLYTHQQFSIIKVNYEIKKCENHILQLLDHYHKLMYNVTTLETPANLEAKLYAKGLKYDMPRRWLVVKGEESKPAYELVKVAKRRNVVLEKLFNFMTLQAEAQTPKK